MKFLATPMATSPDDGNEGRPPSSAIDLAQRHAIPCTRDCCKYFFSNRVIHRWNQLDQRTVGASSIIVFKGHLHKIRETIQGAAKKSSPLMVFANFSAVVPEFKVKFGTLV